MRANLHRLLVAVALIAPAPSAFADVITDWNERAVAVVTGKMAPAAGQRVVTIMHLAMFDAVNSIDRRYRPYLTQLPAAASTSKEAAAAAAAGSVLASLNPQAEGELRSATAAYLATIPDSDAKAQGIKLGEAIAAKILEARAGDGAARVAEHALAHRRQFLRDQYERSAVNLDARIEAIGERSRRGWFEGRDHDRIEAAHHEIALQRHQEWLPLAAARERIRHDVELFHRHQRKLASSESSPSRDTRRL